MSDRDPLKPIFDDIDLEGVDLGTEAWTKSRVLENILRGAHMLSESTPHEGDERTDQERIRDYADDLNSEVVDEDLHHERVHIRYSRTKNMPIEDYGDVHSMYAYFGGFVPYEAPTVSEHGFPVEAGGWKLGVQVYTAESSNFSRISQYRHTIIPVDDPMFDLVAFEDSLSDACESAQTRLEAEHEIMKALAEHRAGSDQPLFPRDFARKETLDALIRHVSVKNMRPKNIRKIAKLATKLVNSTEYMENPSLQDDVEIILRRGFEPGRYAITANQSATVHQHIDNIQQPFYEKSKRMANVQIDGILLGAILLPDVNKGKRIVPSIVLSPTSSQDKLHQLQIVPMEGITSILRKGDAAYTPLKD